MIIFDSFYEIYFSKDQDKVLTELKPKMSYTVFQLMEWYFILLGDPHKQDFWETCVKV